MTLQLESLNKRFDKVQAIDALSLTSNAGEFITVVGPSGCGKTTLLRIIAGLERPDSGNVHVAGRDVTSATPRDRDVAMVFQGESLYPHMTAFENMAFPLRMRGVTREEITETVTGVAKQLSVDTLLDRMPSSLSGGQRQRVALGRALARKPSVFLLDEPFSHLDPRLRRQLRQELRKLRQDWQATTLFVTHDQREALLLGDRVAVMKDGAIQQFDRPDVISQSPANAFVAEFLLDEYAE